MADSKFYAQDDLTAWERVKKAFANDWEQTRADLGAKNARDMNQDADDTVKQMLGTANAFENREQAFRFGYAAQRRYGSNHPQWNDALDAQLRQDYEGDYDADRDYIEYAYGRKYSM